MTKMKIIYAIGHRGSNSYRVKNIAIVLEWLKNFNFVPVIVEQDDTPKIDGIVNEFGFKYIFAKNTDLYNRSWSFNIVHKHIGDYDAMVCADNDMIMSPEDINSSLKKLDNYGFIKPFKNLVDLSEDETRQVYTTKKLSINRPLYARSGMNLSSGICALTKETFEKIGGWDERFMGWGGEDDAMTVQLEKNNISVFQEEYSCYHLFHTRSALDGSPYHPHYSKNIEYINEHIAGNYIKNIDNIGNINKYNI